jgi:hypothetical protein
MVVVSVVVVAVVVARPKEKEHTPFSENIGTLIKIDSGHKNILFWDE